MFLNVVDVAVVPREAKAPRIASLVARLELIERRHGEYTGPDIFNLIEILQGEQGESKSTDTLNDFFRRLTDAISSFEKKRPDVDSLTQDLRSVEANLSEIDTGREELIEELQVLETTYESVTGLRILTLILDLEQQSDTDFDVAQQRDKLINLAGTFEAMSSNMPGLISDLQKIKDDAEMKDDEEKSGSHLQVEVDVENRSRYENDIYRKAMIAVSHDNNVQYFELDLSGGGQLAAYSLERKVFQSRSAEDMDKGNRDFMVEFNHKADNFQCKIGVFDLHRNIWVTESQGCKDNGADLESLRGALRPS